MLRENINSCALRKNTWSYFISSSLLSVDYTAFRLDGSTDVALGWPLRYSHSPGEVIDLRGLDALARVVTAIGRRW